MDELKKLAEDICDKAVEIGYYSCGIAPLPYAVEGYTDFLDIRYGIFPGDRQFKAERNYKMGRPQEDYPWAKSVLVATIPYGKYRLPERFAHRVGRIFAFDHRQDANIPEHSWDKQMSDYLDSVGVRWASSPGGIVPLRLAAERAGLGIVRHNNFFYTEEYGSFVALTAWLLDRPFSLIRENHLKPCPESCRRCIDSCPTGSLSAPNTMQRRTCVSAMTTKYPEGRDVTRDDIGLGFDGWMYGCDACQEACPFNYKPMHPKDDEPRIDFPDLDDFAGYMDPVSVLGLSDEYLEEHFQPKFWYMPKGSAWKWKCNAMCALITEDPEKAAELIPSYLDHPEEMIRKTAQWALQKLSEMQHSA